LLNKILNSKPEDLSQFRGTVLEIWLAAGATNAIKTGDYSRLMLLLDRIVGKPSDKVELEVKPVEAWTKEEKLKLLEESRESLRKLEEELKGE